jgi:hypothetical protein
MVRTIRSPSWMSRRRSWRWAGIFFHLVAIAAGVVIAAERSRTNKRRHWEERQRREAELRARSWDALSVEPRAPRSPMEDGRTLRRWSAQAATPVVLWIESDRIETPLPQRFFYLIADYYALTTGQLC